MTCFLCLAEFERRERERPDKAFTVYKGMALCNRHVNTVRGLPADFTQYDLIDASSTETDGMRHG